MSYFLDSLSFWLYNQTKEKIMADLENLEESIEDLKKQVFYLKKIVEGGGSSGGGTSNSGGWKTIFDKESTDEKLNFGLTDGILGSTGIIPNFPDLENVNLLKFTVFIGGDRYHRIIDISRKWPCTYRLFSVNTEITRIFNFTCVMQIIDNKKTLNFTYSTIIRFAYNKYPVFENFSYNKDFHIEKIQAK